MKTKTKAIIILIPLFLIAMVVLRIAKSNTAVDTRRQNVPVVKVDSPQRQTIVQSLQLTGDILPIQQSQVYSRVNGNLEAVYANMGDYVRKDELLARIDTTELAQQYQQAAATYQNAVADFQRIKALRENNLVSQQDLDNAETAQKVAQANYAGARTRLDYAQIAAPFSGFITGRFLDPGALVSSSNVILFTLMNIDVVKVVVSVLEKDVPLVKIGSQAVLIVDAYPGREFVGSVARQSQALDLNTRTMEIEIDIPNHDHTLKPGMFANVSLILLKRENSLTVPTQAILQDAGGSFVYVADDKIAHRKAVTSGVEQNSRTEILAGLKDDDKVIVVGQQFAREGGQVQAQPLH